MCLAPCIAIVLETSLKASELFHLKIRGGEVTNIFVPPPLNLISGVPLSLEVFFFADFYSLNFLNGKAFLVEYQVGKPTAFFKLFATF